MELKLYPHRYKYAHTLLLIVPYGIETHILQSEPIRPVLLIVPYGIETAILPIEK